MRPAIAAIMATLACACSVEPPCPAADLAPLTRTPAWAVINSDFGTTAVAMLDRDGTLITEAWLDSGTRRPGITATLSGDVVLPTRSLAPGIVALIDRLGVDVLTRISVPDHEVVSQTHVQSTSADETGFRANPQDALTLDDGRVLVSRLTANLNAEAGAFDRGDDLVVLDVDDSEIVDEISLAAFVGAPGTYFARPATMAFAGARVIVGLARMSERFDVAGPGAFAVLDPSTRAVTAVDLPELANCGTLAPISGDPSRVVVLCGGLVGATAAAQRPRAGLVVVRIDASGNAMLEHVWRARDHVDLPVPYWAVASLGGTRVVYDALGYQADGSSASLVALDLATDEARVVIESSGELVFGDGAYDAAQRLLLIPDANVGLRRFDVGDGLDITPRDVIDTSPCRRLPPRQVRAL